MADMYIAIEYRCIVNCGYIINGYITCSEYWSTEYQL